MANLVISGSKSKRVDVLALSVLVALAAAVAIALFYHSLSAACLLSMLAILLAAIAWFDLRSFRIPDFLSAAVFGLGLIVCVLDGTMMADWNLVAGALFAPTALLMLRTGYHQIRKHHGLGLGDVKLAAGAGIWVGADHLAECLLSACVIAFAGIAIAMLRQERSTGEGIVVPFGAALAPSIWIFAFFRLCEP